MQRFMQDIILKVCLCVVIGRYSEPWVGSGVTAGAGEMDLVPSLWFPSLLCTQSSQTMYWLEASLSTGGVWLTVTSWGKSVKESFQVLVLNATVGSSYTISVSVGVGMEGTLYLLDPALHRGTGVEGNRSGVVIRNTFAYFKCITLLLHRILLAVT